MAKSASDSPSLAAPRKLDLTTQPETQTVVAFDDNRAASSLVGPYGQNLALIERRMNVVVDSRGNHITLAGTRDACDAAKRVLETLYAQAMKGHDIAQGDVEGAIRAVLSQGSLFSFDAKDKEGVKPGTFEAINLRKRPVRARTAAQDSYIRALKSHELVFGIGPRRHRQDMARGGAGRATIRAQGSRPHHPVASGGGSRRASWIFARRSQRKGRSVSQAHLRRAV